MNRRTLFGKIVRTHGNKGALLIKQEGASKAKLKKTEPVFVDIQPTPVPFFIEDIKVENNGFYILKFQWLNTPEQAAKFCGLNIYLDRKEKSKNAETDPSDLIGFTVIDEYHGETGIIERIKKLPMQNIFVIKKNDKEILIPVVENFIVKIDIQKKIIEIAAPQGLIDLYL